MVTRAGLVLAVLVLAGCPDDVGPRPTGSVMAGLRAPTDLDGVPQGGSSLTLTWTDWATNESGYRLEVNHGPFGSGVVVDLEFLPANATYRIYATTPNTTYYFRILAITDTMQSEPSNVLVLTTPPAEPEGVVATPTNYGTIAVEWQDVAGESGYVIERSIDGSPWVEVGTAPEDGRTYLSEALAPDTRMAHRVIAVGVHGRSTPSLEVIAQTVTDKVRYSYPPPLGNNGLFTSLVVPHPGVVHVAQQDAGSTSVTYSFQNGPLSPWATSTADGGGEGLSLAVEGDVGTPQKAHLVSHDRTNDVLRYATNASGSWVRTALDNGGSNPRIARHPSTGALHVAFKSSKGSGDVLLRVGRKLPGQAWTFRTFVGLPLDPSATLALDLDGAGRPHVLLVGAGGSLVHAFENSTGGLASEQVLIPALHGPPDYTSLVLEPGGTIHAFYRGSASKSLHHLSRTPGAPAWQDFAVDDAPGQDVGSYCSACFDAVSNLLHVAYYDATRGDLKCATLDPGQGWRQRIIDTAGDVGTHVSMAGVWGGTLYFAYRDATQKRLKLAVKQF